jgi:hydroxymethylglutaryl-CoA reductase
VSKSSRIPGFYKRSPSERVALLQRHLDLEDDDLEALSAAGGLGIDAAEHMIENCIGTFGLPVGLGLNFLINGRDYVVPMVVEEPSIVAAVSNTAKLVREGGGFLAEADRGVMIGQVQLLDVADLERAAEAIRAEKHSLLAEANAIHPRMTARGGGALDLEVRVFHAPERMLVVHVLADCMDAMGANAINTMAEGIAARLEALSGGRALLRILSNLADRRLARARFALPDHLLEEDTASGAQVARDIVSAYHLAVVDVYRAATHNKGIMNGVDAVALATGNDWRSVEAGAHAYAARDGRYTSLTHYRHVDGVLHGRIELPLAVGVIGGSTHVHPTLRTLHKILGVTSARELACVMAATGLAQNLGALRALATAGISRGHMRLHARSVALAAGARGEEAERVASQMIALGEIKPQIAADLLSRREAG